MSKKSTVMITVIKYSNDYLEISADDSNKEASKESVDFHWKASG